MLTAEQVDMIKIIAIRKMNTVPEQQRLSDHGFKQRTLAIKPFCEKLGLFIALFEQCIDLDKLYTLEASQFDLVTSFINAIVLEDLNEPA